jgi:hypothetical protein
MTIARWQPWRVEELEALAAGVLAGKSGPELAAESGRTLAGVKFQLARMRLRIRATRRPRADDWQPWEDAEAVRLLAAGWQLWRIGRACGGRSVAAVSARLRRLGVAVPKGRVLAMPLPHGARPGRPRGAEPTAEEVEAMVAEQSRPENLPRWWFRERESEKQPGADELRELSAVARRGRALEGHMRARRMSRGL